MKNPSSPKITFYHVKDNSAKVQLICTKAQEAFKQEKRLLIAVPNFEAAQYIDALLWQTPAHSFLPHVIADTSSSEWIAITLQEEHNVNRALCLLNLCSTSPALFQQMEEVFELYDETHPQKKELSQKRLELYQTQGLNVKLDN